MEVINIDKDSELVLDVQTNDLQININKCRAIITDISNTNKNIVVNDGELDYCYVKKNTSDDNVNVVVNHGSVNMKVIDILETSSSNEYSIGLESEDSDVDISIASVSRANSKKDYTINTTNSKMHTKTKIDCFGIVEDTSRIKYDITSAITKGAKKSVVDQSSKILLFDKESIGLFIPILSLSKSNILLL